MIVKQLTVFLQNEAGRLEELTSILGKNDINISAISIAESAEFGVVRMIVNNCDKAVKVLKENEFSVKTVNVIGIETPDTPGSLCDTLQKFASAGINVSYMYGYSTDGVANIIMKVSDPDKALSILSM